MSSQIIDISIIIVNWNTKEYLLNCIDSLKKETKHSILEIIVVDNGSKDGSQEALKKKFPDILLIENKQNLGFSKANNIGLKIAHGRYICLMNTDIIVLDNCVDIMLVYADTHPDVGALGPKTVDEKMQLRPNCRYFPNLRNAYADYLLFNRIFPNIKVFQGRTLPKSACETTHEAEALSGCFLLVRREAFEEVGLLDERFFFYGEDTDWCKRFIDAGWKLIFLSDARVIHFGGGSSSAYPLKYYLALEKADLQYWQKHHSIFACHIYKLIKSIYHFLIGSIWLLGFLFLISNRKKSKLKTYRHFSCLFWLLFKKKQI